MPVTGEVDLAVMPQGVEQWLRGEGVARPEVVDLAVMPQGVEQNNPGR